MEVVFMGTPDFAVPCLEKLFTKGYNVKAVFTQPDKKRGRKQILTAPEVKKFARSKGINVYQPETLKNEEVYENLKVLKPDIIVVVAYGKMLPENILKLPKYGCVNVHGSLLPKYRGAAPIQWSIINGEKTTGVTTMLMNKGMDTGDILLQDTVDILEDETSGELYERLKILGAEVLIKTLKQIENGTIKAIKQDEKLACEAPMLNKEIALINWNKSAKDINNLIRGLNPWPIAHTYIDGEKIKIYKAKLAESMGVNSGEIISLNPLVVCCGDGRAIEIKEVQPEGKRLMGANDFVNGRKISINETLG